MEEDCCTCNFYVGVGVDVDEKRVMVGECRRYPPVHAQPIVGLRVGRSEMRRFFSYPLVAGELSQGCGEYKRKEQL